MSSIPDTFWYSAACQAFFTFWMIEQLEMEIHALFHFSRFHAGALHALKRSKHGKNLVLVQQHHLQLHLKGLNALFVVSYLVIVLMF